MDRRNVLPRLGGSTAVCFLFGIASATANELSLPFGVEGSYNLTLNYAVAMRMQDQDPALTDGTVDPLRAVVLPEGQIVGFERTGLPDTSNSDDGNRNFDKYSLINNRVSALFEADFEYENFAFVLSGNAFYDDVFFQENDNENADFLNRFDDTETYNDAGQGRAGDREVTNKFSDAARSRVGRRARLLDAYLVADFPFGDASYLNLRIGQQVVSWGEALFFGGMARDMGVADAAAGFVPGAEVKDILLPQPQVSFRMGLGWDWTLKGYYKFTFKSNEVFPVGHYFSPADVLGPGAEFAYGSINPAYLEGCPGLLDVGQFNDVLGNLLGGLSDLSQLCNLGGLGGALLNARPNILTFREEDIEPSSRGQFGVGLDYRLTPGTSVSAHYISYHNPNPALKFTTGFAKLGELAGIELTTGLINQRVPVTYNVTYFDNIDLYNVSFSSTLFGLSVAGEVNYRDGVNLDVLTIASGVPFPEPQRGETVQGLVSAINTFNPPGTLFDGVSIVGEVQYIRVLDVDPIRNPQPGIEPAGDGDELFFVDNDAAGFQFLVLPGRRNVISGWDFTGLLSYADLTYGNPAQSGSFGALFGEGDRRLSVGGTMQYLQNLSLGLTYNFFFGDPEATIGESFQRQNPFVDRDYLSFNAKYRF
ncbi:DUF1302 domain-containing protein [Algiphilus aromaticivorans]|uniref:DUF1302 domain-containing protein n=1 Tax=Algiphilus aromaticivorans TaxID=382454 RepID=UPI000A078168|nr:DUF1302 family protein [Algiphilus aromaticivorans]